MESRDRKNGTFRARSQSPVSRLTTDTHSVAQDGDQDQACSLQEAHRSSNSHNFIRHDSDWLRKRAITGAMKNTVAEPRPQAFRSRHSSERQTGGARFEFDHDTHAPRNQADEHSDSPDAPVSHRTWAETKTSIRHDGPALFLSKADVARIEEERPEIFLNQLTRDTGPTSHGSGTGNSPPPATIGNLDSWLLPHPFKHDIGPPLVEKTFHRETGGGFHLQSAVREPSPSSTPSHSEVGRRAGTATPIATGNGHREPPRTRSAYFQKAGQVHASHSRSNNEVQTPSSRDGPGRTSPDGSFDVRSTPSSDIPERRPLSEMPPNIPHLSSDPFVASESDMPPTHHKTRSRHHRPHDSASSADRLIRDAPGYSEVHSRPYSESPELSSPNHAPGYHRSESFRDLTSKDNPSLYTDNSEPEYRRGPSVISGAMTQTFTPDMSPYGQKPPLTGFRGDAENADGIRRHGQARHRRQLSSDRAGAPPQTYSIPQSGPRRIQPDSSILSPLAHRVGPRSHPRTPSSLGTHTPSARKGDEETEILSALDLGLSSDSDSETEDDRYVNSNPRVAPEPPVNHRPAPGRASGVTEEEDRVVCAISESRASDVIGVAVINMTIGRVDITRIVNDDRYERLVETVWRMPTWPQTFLVLKKVIDEHSKSSLAVCLRQEFPDAEVVPLEREHWNESEGLRMVDRFALRGDVKAIRKNLEHNFYAACAFSAVMAYVEEETEISFRENSLRIKYIQPADTMGLDRSTITSLELLQNVRLTKGKSSTLFGLLNNTLTPQGRRLLRSTLLQPSTNRGALTARHEAVEELSSNEDLFTEVRASLKRLLHIDVERSIPWVALKTGDLRPPLEDRVDLTQGHHDIVMPSHEELQAAEKDLNHILMIKAYLAGIGLLRDTLEASDCTSQLCRWVLENCGPENTAAIASLIGEAIEEDATYSKAPIDIRNNRLWAVKAGPRSVLERARQLYRERTNEMHEYVEEINKAFQENLGTVPELRLANDNHYYLRFQWSDVEREVNRHLARTGKERLGGVQHWRQRFIGGVEIVNGIRRKQHYDCQTMELIQKSSQIQRQADIVTGQSDRSVVELKNSLMEHSESLLALSEATALLDMLYSFAHLATTQNYVRPIISDTLVLKRARHPVAEVRKNSFVPNDVYLGNQDARFQLITGGNMSGKSTFIRSVALIQIMAQIGSFVPAQYAAIPICDRLFTRLSTEDKPESNLGTFAVEMTEMNMILRQASKDSLVIIDELGRGTSTKEGLAIALAMSEKLVGIGCRVFFATHFTELARILNSTKPSSVLNVHVVGERTRNGVGDTPQITLPHTMASGPVKNEDYGLDLARRFLPERVIKNAEHICKFLRDRKGSKAPGPATRALKQNKLIMALPDLLQQAYDSTMDDSALASYLKKLQTEFTIRMNMAADDSKGEGEEAGPANSTTEHPVLEKPSKEELQEWKKKCDEAERRVMLANMAHSQQRKRPAGSGPGNETDTEYYPQKRNKTDDGRASTSQPTPINRGSMIEELRRESFTPSHREDTLSSFTMDATSSSSVVDRDSVIGDVVPHEGSTSAEIAAPGRSQRAISISSGSSSNYGDEMDGMDGDSDALSPSVGNNNTAEEDRCSEATSQPLDRFQPLRKWYAHHGRATMSGREESEPATTPVPKKGLQGRPATQESLYGPGEKDGNDMGL